MELQNISNAELINRMQKLVRTERKITHLILTHILEIESRRIYAELGYDGMYTYLTRGLGYSEAAAYRRLQSARLLKQIPEVAEKIESGALHLSQLTRVQKCLKEAGENGIMVSSAMTSEILANLENKNSFETEVVLAKKFDLPFKVQDILRPQSDDSIRLEITFTAEQFKDLEKAKDLLSHICHEGPWSEVIATLAKKFNNKNEGAPARQSSRPAKVGCESVEEINRQSTLNTTDEQLLTTQRVVATKVSSRKAISAKIRRHLLGKSDACCAYQNPKTGKACGSKYQLQIDHIEPLAFGGSNNLENLRVLCRTHNLQAASQAGLARY